MLLADALKDVGARDIGEAIGQLEEAVRAIAAGVHDALGNALVIEVEDLLAEVEIFEQRRTARALAQGVLVVGDGNALLRRQGLYIVLCDLMGFASGSAILAAFEARVTL